MGYRRLPISAIVASWGDFMRTYFPRQWSGASAPLLFVLVVGVASLAWADEIPDAPEPSVPPSKPAASAPQPKPAAKVGGSPSSEHGSLAEIGAKLANPISDVWAMFTQFGMTFSDGDVNTGDPEIGGNMEFQPILPVPIYGSGDKAWRLIVRPTIPVLFGNPIPRGFNSFHRETGLGDILLPLPLSIPAGNWILAAGPTFTLPTSTHDAFGRQQWAIGPTAVFGYKTKAFTAVVFPQYFFGIGSRGDQGSKPDASYMEMLYSVFFNLPDAWQVGFNPTILYDNKATSGNKWNVPIGLTVAKTIKVGKTPLKLQFGLEYSVVSQDDYGQRFQIKLNLIPVIKSLIQKPLFGGA
jgi:hypothetical protein